MGRYWSASVGQDFAVQHAPGTIDFAAIHLWPDNWNTTELAFPPVWIDTHIQESRKIGKPLLLEEFGKQSNGAGDKQPYYDAVYGESEEERGEEGKGFRDSGVYGFRPEGWGGDAVGRRAGGVARARVCGRAGAPAGRVPPSRPPTPLLPHQRPLPPQTNHPTPTLNLAPPQAPC